jgi:hypothetical protein
VSFQCNFGPARKDKHLRPFNRETVSNWQPIGHDVSQLADMTVVYEITDRGGQLLEKWGLK